MGKCMYIQNTITLNFFQKFLMLCFIYEQVLFEEFALTSKNYIRKVTTTRGEWLVDMAPHYFDLDNFPECEAKDELILEYKKKLRRE